MVGVESRYREWSAVRVRGSNELEFYWQNALCGSDQSLCCWQVCGGQLRFMPRLVPQRRQHNARLAVPTPAISLFSMNQGAMSASRSTASGFAFTSSPARTSPTLVLDRAGSRSAPLVGSRTRGRFMRWTSTPRRFITLPNVRKRINS